MYKRQAKEMLGEDWHPQDKQTLVDDSSLKAFIQHAENQRIITPDQAQRLDEAGTAWLRLEGKQQRPGKRKCKGRGKENYATVLAKQWAGAPIIPPLNQTQGGGEPIMPSRGWVVRGRLLPWETKTAEPPI